MLAVFVGAAFVAGAVGSWATFPNVRDWFPGLAKPAWNPPAWLFAPVWTALYVLMGVALWRAWRTGPAARPLVSGTKGVHGGAVHLVGTYRGA